MDQLLKHRSYIHGGSNLSFRGITLAEALEDIVKHLHSEEAFVYRRPDSADREVTTYGEWRDQSIRFAAGLASHGIGKGNRMALLIPNSKEFIIATWGLFYAGAAAAFLNYDLKSGEDIADKIKRIDCKGLIIFNDGSDTFNNVMKILANNSSDGSLRIVIVGDISPNGLPLMTDVIASATPDQIEAVVNNVGIFSFDDEAVIALSSGSTGVPKVIPMTHFALVNNVSFMMSHFAKHTTGDRFFNDRPLSWLGGFFGPLTVVLCGGAMVSVNTSAIVGDSNVNFILDVLESEKITVALVMPYLLHDILQSDLTSKYSLPAMTTVLMGGQKMPGNDMETLCSIYPHLNIVTGYGSSEVAGFAFCTELGDPFIRNERVTAGRIMPHCEAKIINENKNIVPVGDQGEICIRKAGSVSVCFADDNGWFPTGDIGELDQEGWLFITGRAKDVIKRGTLSIVPGSIEATLVKHPAADDVYVVGVPDARLFEEICACIQIKKGEDLTEPDMKTWCDEMFDSNTADGLSSAPRYFVFVEEFPLLPNGKIDRKLLRKVAAKKLGLADQAY